MPAKLWLSPNQLGLPHFGFCPVQLLLDPELGPRELRVFLCLAVHADSATGKCTPSQDRIAEMCGYYKKGKPDRSLVSTLIHNLVLRGWVKNLGQQGFNRTNVYQVRVPKDIEFRSVSTRRTEQYIQQRDDAELNRALQGEGFESSQDFFDYMNSEGRYADEEARRVKQKQLKEADGPDLADMTFDAEFTDEEVTREDCLRAIQNYRDGFDKDLRSEVLARFGLEYPANRDTA